MAAIFLGLNVLTTKELEKNPRSVPIVTVTGNYQFSSRNSLDSNWILQTPEL